MMIDGITILAVLALAGLALWLFTEEPRYRCGASFEHFPWLLDHEAGHRPERACACAEGVHHPSCPTRGNLPRRAAA
ncbi:MAG: hypothetical protein Q4F65_11300 [Propionibacteriaceae bacterium]|nr:hypothetical protein [Propionibacteriaceae bacterium]